MPLNGQFPDTLLTYLGWPEADHLRLVPDAAASLNRLAVAFEARFGKPLYITDAYRTLATQVSLKIRKGTFAARPGTSNHGWGLAIDMASRINVDNSDEHRWMETNGPHFGWINPWWAEDRIRTNGEYEPWHWEFHSDLDRSTNSPTHTPTPTPTEDDMDATQDARLTNAVEILAGMQNAISDPNIGLTVAANGARDAAVGAKDNANRAVLAAENAANIASEIRNLIVDPKLGILATLRALSVGDVQTSDISDADLADIATAVADELHRRSAS